MRPLWDSFWAIGEVLVLKSSLGSRHWRDASMGTDLLDGRNDETQGESAIRRDGARPRKLAKVEDRFSMGFAHEKWYNARVLKP